MKLNKELGELEGKNLKLELEAIGLDGIRNKIRELQKMLDDTKNPLGNEERKQVMGLVDAYQGYEKILKRSQVKLQDSWGSIKGIGNSVETLTDALQGDGNAWESVCGVIDGVLGLYDGIKEVIGIVEALTGVTNMLGIAKAAETSATVLATDAVVSGAAEGGAASLGEAAAAKVSMASWEGLAAAKFMAAHAEIPFAGFGIASGYIGGMESLLAACSVPKFANGAIAYGPTLGLFGEYAGASSNPEVVAPLDRLQDLIDRDNGGDMLAGRVKFEIEGRKLVGVLRKEDKMKCRT